MPIKGVIFVFLIVLIASFACRKDLLPAIKDLFSFTDQDKNEKAKEDSEEEK